MYTKQLYLFNNVWCYDKEYDDMEADDYEEAYFNYLLDHIDEEINETNETFELSKDDNGKPLTCQ